MSQDAAASAIAHAPIGANANSSVMFQGWSIPCPAAPSGPGQFVSSPVEGVSSVVTRYATVPAAACTHGQSPVLAFRAFDVRSAMQMLGGAFREAKTAVPGQPVPAANEVTLVAMQTLTVRFRWESVLQQSAQAGGMHREVSYQTGVSKTDSTTTEFSIAIGIEDSGELLGVGAKLTETFSYSQSETHEISVSTVTTETQGYDIPPNTSIQAWQLVQIFEAGPVIYDLGKYGQQASVDGKFTVRPGATLTVKTPTIVSLSYPR